MENKYKIVKSKLEKCNQEQLLSHYEYLTDENKEILLDAIVNINFEQVEKLYKNTKETNKVVTDKIEPISYYEKEKFSEEERKYYEELGTKIIKNGEFSVVTMAGGQRN